MSALPSTGSRVNVVLAFTLVLAFCAAFLGSTWLANLYVLLGVVYAGGSVMFPLVRDLLGLPPRGTFERCLRIVREFQESLNRVRAAGPRHQAEEGHTRDEGPHHRLQQPLRQRDRDGGIEEPELKQHQSVGRRNRVPRRQANDPVVGKALDEPRRPAAPSELGDVGVVHQPAAGADRTVRQQERKIREEGRIAEDAQ
jgi:hypothetical protein